VRSVCTVRCIRQRTGTCLCVGVFMCVCVASVLECVVYVYVSVCVCVCVCVCGALSHLSSARWSPPPPLAKFSLALSACTALSLGL
jgi:hypothetical protein